jgi:hypothetical protein
VTHLTEVVYFEGPSPKWRAQCIHVTPRAGVLSLASRTGSWSGATSTLMTAQASASTPHGITWWHKLQELGGDGIWVMNNGRVTYANPESEYSICQVPHDASRWIEEGHHG